MTLHEFMTDWHKCRSVHLRKSTYEAEEIYLTRHIIPYFDQVCPELEKIKPLHVQGYISSKLSGGRHDGKMGGLSSVSVRKHLAILRQALNDAVIWEYITHNPATAVKVPKSKNNSPITERTVFLQPQEAQNLLDSLTGHKIYPAVVLALLYGLRRSEVLGLRWDAINFREDTLTICHTVVKNLSIEASDNTKTASSKRTFQLLPEVSQMLLAMKEKSVDSIYLFSRENGSPWRPDYLTRAFQKQLKKLGLPKMRFHDLRHSTASILFERGWGLEDVKNWLGHSDIETTSNIYLHYGRSRKVLMAKKLGGVFKLS